MRGKLLESTLRPVRERTSTGCPRSFTGFSAGLSAVIPLRGALEIEFGGVYSIRSRARNHLALTALARVNLPLAEHGWRAFLMAGPSVAWDICPAKFRGEQSLDL